MKYVIEYQIRNTVLTHDQNFANQDALLKAFGTWTPEEDCWPCTRSCPT